MIILMYQQKVEDLTLPILTIILFFSFFSSLLFPSRHATLDTMSKGPRIDFFGLIRSIDIHDS